jgi:cell division protein FtsZ
MAISLSAPRTTELKPRIVVFGVGGAGGNAVNNMIEAGLEGVEFVVANTDAQQLQFAKTDRRIQLGVQITQGLGAGAHPEVGMSAAEESFPEIGEHLDGAHMVFITAGMGGGTGTGAAPIIAKCARERGILTVGVVTKPFHFEGRHRMRLADAGIQELQRYVDTLIVIPNQNLFRVANERTTFAEAFAIANPLLDEVSLKGAKAVLVNVTGGMDMTLLEVDEAANAISDQVDPEANIIFGAAFDPSLEGVIRVSVVATGMDGASIAQIEPKPVTRNTTTQPLIADTARAPQPEPARPTARYEAARPAERPSSAFAPEPIPAPEPEIVMAAAPEPEAELYYDEPTVAEEPRIAATAARSVTRIVDPMVDDGASEEPLFPENNYYEERRPQKQGGWLSMFGGNRQRYEQQPSAPQPQARSTQSARPQLQPLETPQADDGEDLEIPSFLRRLAN